MAGLHNSIAPSSAASVLPARFSMNRVRYWDSRCTSACWAATRRCSSRSDWCQRRQENQASENASAARVSGSSSIW
jgi:hypothetical protein